MIFERYFKEYLSDFNQVTKENWNYPDGCIMTGAGILYEATGDTFYLNSILKFAKKYVEENGKINGFNLNEHNVDQLRCGMLLFFLYENTGEEKYRTAIETLMDNLRTHPRTSTGNFWHKQIYPYQVWLDGLYMAMPLYLKYDTLYNDHKNYGDIISQFKNVRTYLYSAEKRLYYHAYDEKKVMIWADQKTGQSPSFWLRAMGWYLMALVDCYEIMAEEAYDQRHYFLELLKEAIQGILSYQDKESGLFYQLIDRADLEGNYLETSGSAMVAYTIIKGCRLGMLQKEKYFPVGEQILAALEAEKLKMEEGKLQLHGTCASAGLGPKDERNGSPEYYLSERIAVDNAHGAATCMMAYGEWLKWNLK